MSADRSKLRPQSRRRAAWALGVALVVCGAGCGSVSRPPPWSTPTEKRFWPPPPEPARIEYVGALVSAADLGPDAGWMARIADVVLGQAPSRMVRPVAVAKNRAGMLVVADPGVPTVHFFDLERRAYRRIDEEIASKLRSPVGVAIDQEGWVYVTDSAAGVLLTVSPDGALTGQIGQDRLTRPTGVALSPDEQRLYVVDTVACQVVIFDRSGRELSRFGERGNQPGTFNAPTYIAVSARGQVSVADSLNFRVQIFEADGQWVSSFGTVGDGAGTFARPKGVAIDDHGRLFVVDAAFENVQIFNADGMFLLDFGGPGQGSGEFSLPGGIFVEPSGMIWIADAYNQRVQVFRLGHVAEEEG